MNYRKLARGKPCLVRVGPQCHGQDESVHAAHYRMLPYNGTGLKPPDVPFSAWACSYCAAATGEGSSLYNRLALAEGCLRTIHELIQLGKVKL